MINNLNGINETKTRYPISLKLSAVIILLILLQTSILFWLSSNHLATELFNEKTEDLQSELISLQQTLQHLASKNEFEQIQKTVSSLGAKSDLHSAFLLDANKNIIAATRLEALGKSINEYSPPDQINEIQQQINSAKKNAKNSVRIMNNGQAIVAISPVILGRTSSESIRSDKIGFMYINTSMDWVNLKTSELLQSSFLPFVISLFLTAIALATYFHITISQRINQVNKTAKALVKSDYSVRLKITGNDELTQLGQTFNNMAEQINLQHNALSKSEQRLKKTQEIARLGSWELDLTTNTLSWSDEVYQIFGLVPQQFAASYEAFLQHVHPDDRDRVNAAYSQSISEGADSYEIEHRVVQESTREIRYVLEKCVHDKDANGNVIRSFGMIHDITDNKKLLIELEKSEEKFRTMTENVPGVTYRCAYDNNRTMFFMSNDIFHLSGYPASEFIDNTRSYDSLIHPDDSTLVTEAIKKAIDNKQTYTIEYRVIHQNGSIRRAFEKGQGVLNENGELYCLDGVILDITEEQSTRLELLKNKLEQREILNSMVDSVITITDTGKILTFNRAAEKQFGYEADEIIGKNIKLLMPDPYTHKHDGYLKSYLNSGHARIIGTGRDVEGLRKNGDIFPMRLSVAELPVDNSGQRRFIGTCADLTQVKIQEEQIRRSQKMDAIGKLTGGIAHDYNNMLGVILGFTELLLLKLKDQPALEKYALEIQHAGERGAKLTQNLLSFSRKSVPQASILNINTVLDDEQNLLHKTLTARINLKYNLTNNLWPVWIDGDELGDAILNMCINSMHAIKDDGKITIETENLHIDEQNTIELLLPPGDYVSLKVTDTGCGMDAEIQEKIFDPFFSTKGDKGTGLGLSQVYGFVERSGGTIKIKSAPGQGTEMSLYFPRHMTSEENKKSETSTENISTGKSESILIVDDEPALLNLIAELLNQNSYHVLTANNAKQALEILKSEKIDLLISDIIMPEVNGYQLAAIVQREYPSIKIQLVSGYADENIEILGDNTLKKNLMSKPYSLKSMLKRVRKLLDKKIEKEN